MYMGNQHSFYRVKLGERNQQCIRKYKNTFTYFNIRETRKPTPLHGNFYVDCLILLHYNTRKINFFLVKSLT